MSGGNNNIPNKIAAGGPNAGCLPSPDALCELGKRLSVLQLCPAYALQLKRHVLAHGAPGVPLVEEPPSLSFPTDGPKTNEDKLQQQQQQWVYYRLNETVLLDSLKAAVMDQKYWSDTQARLDDLLPALLQNTSPAFLAQMANKAAMRTAAAQTVAALSAVQTQLLPPVSPTTAAAGCDTCRMVETASERWASWEPTNDYEQELREFVINTEQKRNATLRATHDDAEEEEEHQLSEDDGTESRAESDGEDSMDARFMS